MLRQHVGQRHSTQNKTHVTNFSLHLSSPHNSTAWIIVAPGQARAQNQHDWQNEIVGSLNRVGIATLLINRTTTTSCTQPSLPNALEIEVDASVEQMSEALIFATKWLKQSSVWAGLPLHYLALDSDAVAAWQAASTLGPSVQSVITWNAYAEFIWRALPAITTPSLLLVDEQTSTLRKIVSQLAQQCLSGYSETAIVPSATVALEAYVFSWLREKHCFHPKAVQPKPSIFKSLQSCTNQFVQAKAQVALAMAALVKTPPIP